MTRRDLLGFADLGRDWSWPEFDEAGQMARPAHAHAGPGLAICGEPWPHVWVGLIGKQNAHVPAREHYERIRWSEDRSEFMCARCVEAIRK